MECQTNRQGGRSSLLVPGKALTDAFCVQEPQARLKGGTLNLESDSPSWQKYCIQDMRFERMATLLMRLGMTNVAAFPQGRTWEFPPKS
jgi:hypothetical protein